jgi:hypothetical protein
MAATMLPQPLRRRGRPERSALPTRGHHPGYFIVVWHVDSSE